MKREIERERRKWKEREKKGILFMCWASWKDMLFIFRTLELVFSTLFFLSLSLSLSLFWHFLPFEDCLFTGRIRTSTSAKNVYFGKCQVKVKWNDFHSERVCIKSEKMDRTFTLSERRQNLTSFCRTFCMRRDSGIRENSQSWFGRESKETKDRLRE